MNYILFIGALLGFLGIAGGAYADHVLKMSVSALVMEQINTALRYQQLHAVLLIVLSFHIRQKRFLISSLCFILGITLFSFSIYAAALTHNLAWLKITPSGGSLLMLGWLSLLFAAWRKNTNA